MNAADECPESILDILIAQCRIAAKNGLQFLALSGTLMIPDICAALESPTGETRRSLYEKWFDENVAPAYDPPRLTGADCYQFRCGALHQGRLEGDKGQLKRLLFIERSPVTIHMTTFNGGALLIDIPLFIEDVANGVERWRIRLSGTEPYESNFKKMAHRHANGISPFVGGWPTIG